MRLVQRKQTGTSKAVAAPSPLQDYLERTVKYIPVEVIAAFMVLRSLVPGHGTAGAIPTFAELMIYVVLVALTPLYLLKVGGNVPRKRLQVAVATVSFVVWSYATGGPFFWAALEAVVGHAILSPGLAAAILVLWSLVAGLADPSSSETATVSSNAP